MIGTPRSHLTLVQPTLEQRLDEHGVTRQPRASVLPGLRLPPGTEGELVPLRCPECNRLDGWYFYGRDSMIVCDCVLTAHGK
jgi:hypothetical protein